MYHMMLTHLLAINWHSVSNFDYNLYDLSLSQCLRYRSPVHLTAEKRSQVYCVQVSIEGFSDEELNDMSNFISVD